MNFILEAGGDDASGKMLLILVETEMFNTTGEGANERCETVSFYDNKLKG